MPATPYCTSDVDQVSCGGMPLATGGTVYAILSATLALPMQGVGDSEMQILSGHQGKSIRCCAMATHTGMKQGERVWAILGSTVGPMPSSLSPMKHCSTTGTMHVTPDTRLLPLHRTP